MHIIVVAHNIRSTHNIGAILRTADGFGVQKVFLTGYTPYPAQANDERLPHIYNKITAQIHKTALGAETTVPNEYIPNIKSLLARLKGEGYQLVALEQAENSVLLPKAKFNDKVALLLGEEVHGIEASLIAMCDTTVEIPMQGAKESFNVSVATGIALYELAVCSQYRS